MRGRAFGFVVILCATWVTARIVFVRIADGDRQVVPHYNVPADTMVQPITHIGQDARFNHAPAKTQSVANKTPMESMVLQPNSRMYAIRSNAGGGITDDNIVNPISPEAITFSVVEPREKRGSTGLIKIYAYSFWRQGNAAQGMLGSGQYGGSQSGLLMTIPMVKFPKNVHAARVALIGRASVAHDKPREREWAAGLLWRPSSAFPAQLSLERRFRPDRPDAVAAFISGGHVNTSLPLGFKLDGYGQAGFVTGKAGSGFADAQLHVLKNMASYEHAKLATGGGIWAGGQSGIMRIDIGPALRVGLQTGSTQFQLDASWRFRIAGNARPGGGPAVTLSTNF